jgi:transglutaminase-like putative cysteine protease
MRLRISHATRYTFDRPTGYGLQQLRKTPKSTHNQQVVEWHTSVEGGRKELAFEDHHNNVVELVSFERDATNLVVRSEGIVEIADSHGVIGAHIGPSPLWLYRSATPRTRAGTGVKALLRRVEGADTLERLHALMQAVHEAITYEPGASYPDWGAEEALVEGRGVCQDHTHVFTAAAREMGIPARYVSGYLMLGDRTRQDAMHAWAEAHVEGLGWVGFDAANAISPDTRYVRVATGLDYGEAAPVIGMRQGGGTEGLSVQIEVAQQ